MFWVNRTQTYSYSHMSIKRKPNIFWFGFWLLSTMLCQHFAIWGIEFFNIISILYNFCLIWEFQYEKWERSHRNKIINLIYICWRQPKIIWKFPMLSSWKLKKRRKLWIYSLLTNTSPEPFKKKKSRYMSDRAACVDGTVIWCGVYCGWWGGTIFAPSA